MIYLFHGDNNFSINEAIIELTELVGPKEVRSANIASLEGATFDVKEFGSAAMVVPFMADKRLVIIRSLFPVFEPNQKQSRRKRSPDNSPNNNVIHELKTLLSEMPPTTDVVFSEHKVSPSNPLWGMLGTLLPEKEFGSQLVTIKEFLPLKGQALVQWVNDRALTKHVRLSRTALNSIVALVGEDLWAMDNELEKLSIYRNGQTIETQDIEDLTSGAPEASIFELIDSLI